MVRHLHGADGVLQADSLKAPELEPRNVRYQQHFPRCNTHIYIYTIRIIYIYIYNTYNIYIYIIIYIYLFIIFLYII